MSTILILWLSMIFAHVLADYYFQGILASMKQKDWWKKNAPDPKYKSDYIAALIAHSFMWTFFVYIPLFIYGIDDHFLFVCVSFIANVIFHAVVDDLKANKKRINLITDQTLHLAQMSITLSCFELFVMNS